MTRIAVGAPNPASGLTITPSCSSDVEQVGSGEPARVGVEEVPDGRDRVEAAVAQHVLEAGQPRGVDGAAPCQLGLVADARDGRDLRRV